LLTVASQASGGGRGGSRKPKPKQLPQRPPVYDHGTSLSLH
jgi:hypothetical protein